MAGILCVGGPIKYKLKSDVQLTDDWLFENVVPNIRRRFPNDSRLCRVLATAILFAAMDNEVGEQYMPAAMRDRINAAYIPTHPQIAQPVMRVPLTIYRVQDTLMIDEMILHEQPGGAPAANAPAGAAAVGVPIVNQQQHAQTLINLQALKQAVAQIINSNKNLLSLLDSGPWLSFEQSTTILGIWWHY